MNRLTEAFRGKRAFIPFIAGGYPDIETTEELILAMEKQGADIIEIGIPFSDPIADGMLIEEAYKRALSSGCTTDMLFEMVKRVRTKTNIPLLFMTYINPVFTYGKERFMRACKESGIDGLIVPDIPFEERGELKEECTRHNICLITMISPASEERIEMLTQQAEGFLYCVSPGNDGIAELIQNIKRVSSLPCVIGIELSESEEAPHISAITDADGVIIRKTGDGSLS